MHCSLIGQKEPSNEIKWRVTILKNNYNCSFDYIQGLGYLKNFKKVSGREYTKDIEQACKHTAATGISKQVHTSKGPVCIGVTKPDLLDVVHCLLLDSAVLEFSDFEEWANEYGYNTDSRKAEEIYERCRITSKEFTTQICKPKNWGTVKEELHTIFEDY